MSERFIEGVNTSERNQHQTHDTEQTSSLELLPPIEIMDHLNGFYGFGKKTNGRNPAGSHCIKESLKRTR